LENLQRREFGWRRERRWWKRGDIPK
jgi:hypothetical protein